MLLLPLVQKTISLIPLSFVLKRLATHNFIKSRYLVLEFIPEFADVFQGYFNLNKASVSVCFAHLMQELDFIIAVSCIYVFRVFFTMIFLS